MSEEKIYYDEHRTRQRKVRATVEKCFVIIQTHKVLLCDTKYNK